MNSKSEAADLFDLSGRVAVVTGGSRGLGEQIARGFAAAGADVVIASRKLENCVAVAADIERTTGRRAMPYRLHAGRWDEAEPFVAAVYQEFGACDVLVNNAGVSLPYDDLTDISEAMFDAVVNLCVKGPLRLAVLFAERMRAAGSGSIINVSSTAALRPPPDGLVYAAAKAALNTLTEGLAKVYGPQVRVNALLPGTMRTDVTKAWGDEAVEAAVERVALRRIGEPPEVVGAALLLATRGGSYITGSIVRVDGGIP
jgi:NAD(P)-dependent dehydrogenase (short-subunit alcohol dehydrogenase family)